MDVIYTAALAEMWAVPHMRINLINDAVKTIIEKWEHEKDNAPIIFYGWMHDYYRSQALGKNMYTLHVYAVNISELSKVEVEMSRLLTGDEFLSAICPNDDDNDFFDVVKDYLNNR